MKPTSHTIRNFRTLAVAMVGLASGLVAAQNPAAGGNVRPVPANQPSAQNNFLQKLDLKPSLGSMVPMDAKLVNEKGEEVAFGSMFEKKRPVLLMPIFFACNGVCEQELHGLIKMLTKETSLLDDKRFVRDNEGLQRVIPGRDFDIAVVSIHPKETSDLARAERAKIMQVFNMGWRKLSDEDRNKAAAVVDGGWKFFTGKPEEVKKITDAIGFKYTFDEKLNWVFHPSAVAFLTPEGKVSSYITGYEYPTLIVRKNINRAAANEVGPRGETYLLGCIMLDPTSGKYTVVVDRVVKIAGVLTVFAIAGFIFIMNKNDKNKMPRGGAAA